MNRLEGDVQAVLRPLLSSQTRRLGVQEQAVLTSWATLKFMTIDRLIPLDERPFGYFFTQSECRQFHDTLSIPEILLFVGYYDGPNEASVRFIDKRWSLGDDGAIRVFVSVLVVGRALFLVFDHKGYLPAKALYGWHMPGLALATQCIYPPGNDRVHIWPPADKFDEERIESVIHHFGLTPPNPVKPLRDDVVPTPDTEMPEPPRDQ
ncbi:MAG TPA: hypothetical protein VJ935_01500 [Acidimicrobiia bacterium]|nr:hypothetical protein [Acidimicrobiia bacterium]